MSEVEIVKKSKEITESQKGIQNQIGVLRQQLIALERQSIACDGALQVLNELLESCEEEKNIKGDDV